MAACEESTVRTEIIGQETMIGTHNIGRLDVILILFDALLELVQRHLLVLDDKVDLELLDTETNGNKLRGSPNEAVHLDGTDVGLQFLKIGLVI